LSTVTIVLPKGDPREGAHLGNGVAGRRPLGGGLAVFWLTNELACVFILMPPLNGVYRGIFHKVISSSSGGGMETQNPLAFSSLSIVKVQIIKCFSGSVLLNVR